MPGEIDETLLDDPFIGPVARAAQRIRGVKWGVTGGYALTYYDMMYFEPARIPVLAFAVESEEDARVVYKALEPAARAIGAELAYIVRRDIQLEEEEWTLVMAGIPTVKARDALIDGLELAWRGVEPVAMIVQVFYRYSHREEDYIELVDRAYELGMRGALKMMSLAAGFIGYLGHPTFYKVKIYVARKLRELGEKLPKPSEVGLLPSKEINFVMTNALLSNGLYDAIVRKFAYYPSLQLER